MVDLFVAWFVFVVRCLMFVVSWLSLIVVACLLFVVVSVFVVCCCLFVVY